MAMKDNSKSAVFLTFSGNCKTALAFYQECFGGTLRFETFEINLDGYIRSPIIAGSLFSDRVVIYGSDLVHDEGRKLGNYMAIFLACENSLERKALLKKLVPNLAQLPVLQDDDQKLIEVTDVFDVRWVLST
jgi:PhnB protein